MCLYKLTKNVLEPQPSMSNFVTELQSPDKFTKNENIEISKQTCNQAEFSSTDLIKVCGAIDTKATFAREAPTLPSAEEIAQLIQHKSVPTDFTESQTEMLKASLLNNINGFTHPNNDIGLCTHVEHTIELTDQKPVRMQPYSTSDANGRFIRQETQEWIRKGIIRPSRSAYASPVIVDQPHHETTPKRLCVDYRFLNAKTVKRAYPMPKVDTLIRKVAGSRYLSKLDVKKAFLNIPLREEDISKAAFVTEDGHFEPLRMLFGLCTVPATMQSVMNEGLRELIDNGHVIVYIDDVCIFTDTIEEHIEVLDKVLKALHDLGLRVVYSKCMFAEKRIPFLGLLISQERVTIDPQRIAAIANYTVPQTKSEVRSFLGLASHYHKYIKDFAKIARPLTLLTKKDAIVQWTPECQNAMDTLKERLTKAPILATFNPSLPTQVHVDASHTALGAVLTQTHG